MKTYIYFIISNLAHIIKFKNLVQHRVRTLMTKIKTIKLLNY